MLHVLLLSVQYVLMCVYPVHIRSAGDVIDGGATKTGGREEERASLNVIINDNKMNEK